MAYQDARFGVPSMALAILMIVFGVLIIAFPFLMVWLVGLGLIIGGVLWLVGSFGAGGRLSNARSYAPPPRL